MDIDLTLITIKRIVVAKIKHFLRWWIFQGFDNNFTEMFFNRKTAVASSVCNFKNQKTAVLCKNRASYEIGYHCYEISRLQFVTKFYCKSFYKDCIFM